MVVGCPGVFDDVCGGGAELSADGVRAQAGAVAVLDRQGALSAELTQFSLESGDLVL